VEMIQNLTSITTGGSRTLIMTHFDRSHVVFRARSPRLKPNTTGHNRVKPVLVWTQVVEKCRSPKCDGELNGTRWPECWANTQIAWACFKRKSSIDACWVVGVGGRVLRLNVAVEHQWKSGDLHKGIQHQGLYGLVVCGVFNTFTPSD